MSKRNDKKMIKVKFDKLISRDHFRGLTTIIFDRDRKITLNDLVADYSKIDFENEDSKMSPGTIPVEENFVVNNGLYHLTI